MPSASRGTGRTLRSTRRASTRHDDGALLAGLVHDLRNSLNVFAMWAQLLADGKLDAADVARAHASLRHHARAQAALLAELTAFLTLREDGSALESRPLELATIARAALESVREEAELKEVRIDANIAPARRTVTGDAEQVERAAIGLLRHAIAATSPNGRVDLALRTTGERAELVVADGGPGFAAGAAPRLGDPVWPSDRRAGRATLHLGPAIASRVAALHGGELVATPFGPGHGTIWTLRLPLAPARPAAGGKGGPTRGGQRPARRRPSAPK
jgi:two-component system CheB/CheR fusion protein